MKFLKKIKKVLAGQKKPENWQEARSLLELDEYRVWLKNRMYELDQEISERASQHRDFSMLQQEKVEILAELQRIKRKEENKK